MTTRSTLGVLFAAVVVLGGCSGPDAPSPAATTPVPTTSTPTASSLTTPTPTTPAPNTSSPTAPAPTTPAPTATSPTTPARTASSPTATASAPTASATAGGDPKAPTTPVPPESTGGVRQTVKPRQVESRAPVDLDEQATAGPGVQVRLVSVRKVRATAQLPGEVAGPALAVAVSVDNRAAAAVTLDRVVVDLADASGAPGSPISTPPAKPLPATLAAGGAAEGTYVFTVPSNRQSTVTITVSLDPGQPVLVFRGRVR